MPRDLVLISLGAFLRALAVGEVSVFFALYLASLGYDEVRIGLALTAGLAGMAAGTLVSGLLADRLGRRLSLGFLAGLMGGCGILLDAARDFHPILILSFLGMVNGMGRDRGAAQAIDQALLAQVATPETRTRIFARYTLLVDIGTAIGALLAPGGLLLYAGLLLASGLLCPFLGRAVEVSAPPPKEILSPRSRRLVAGFAALSAVDSFAGGFITRALLSYWFVERFDADPGWVSPLFAAASVANALGYLAAARLARRFGLVNTMAFTHVPANLLLMLVPFAPTFAVAVPVFLVREFFSQMDVPTRQSYLAAIVAENERVPTASLVNMVRNASWVAGPSLAGWAMTLSLSAPLCLAGSLKTVYDFALWAAFRRIRPPEEGG